MTEEITCSDDQLMRNILERSHWLFYGELEEQLAPILLEIALAEFPDHGFEVCKRPQSEQLAYWLVILELCALGPFTYGTSPRGAFPWEDGDRFLEIIRKHQNNLPEMLSKWTDIP